MPRENLNDLSLENDAINEYSEKYRDGTGFTNIYERDEQKTKTSGRNIKLNEFEELLLQLGLTKLNAVYSGYGNFKEKCMNTNVYKVNNAVIYCDYDDHLVKNIWIDGFRFNSESEYVTTMVNSLYEVGERWNLILNDWNLSETIDLQSKEEIQKYISEK